MAGYSAFRIFEESLRVDPSEHFLGLRLNMYVASVLTIVGIAWFIRSQRRGRPAAELPARRPDSAPGESAAGQNADGQNAASGDRGRASPGGASHGGAQRRRRPASPRPADPPTAGPGETARRASEAAQLTQASQVLSLCSSINEHISACRSNLRLIFWHA